MNIDGPLVSPSWVHEHLDDPNLVLLDASLASKADGSGADSSPQTLPGALFFDLKAHFSDPNAPFPNTFPSTQQFEEQARALGINSSSVLVVFDRQGLYSAPRVWWMFRTMGHLNVAVLNGGLPAWKNAGFPTAAQPHRSAGGGNFSANPALERIRSYAELVQNTKHPEFLVVDARSQGRFQGTDPEPRPHLKSGHIPGSVCLPYRSVLRNGALKPKDELKALFEEVTGGRTDLVFSCGSGLTACIVLLASEVAYTSSPYLYDGSWTEWAELQGLKTL